MPKAYIKIYVRVGKDRDVREALRKVEEVKAADITAGEQDLIAVVEADTYEDISKVMMEKVRKIDGIERTVTNFAIE